MLVFSLAVCSFSLTPNRVCVMMLRSDLHVCDIIREDCGIEWTDDEGLSAESLSDRFGMLLSVM